MKYRIIILIFAVFGSFNNIFSQNNLDEQTVIIYNEYSPVLKDANRIQSLPIIIDTAKVTNKFIYNATPSLYQTKFQPNTLSVATLKGETLKPLDNGMIKLGFGNYITPCVEVFYNNKRNADYSFGGYLKHFSSHGKTQNAKNQKIYNGFANTLANLYGKKFMSRSTLSADLGFSSNIINYYGYNPDTLENMTLGDNVLSLIERKDMERLNIMRLSAVADLQSNNTYKNRFDFNLNVAYKFLFTNANKYANNEIGKKNNQNKVDVKFNLNKTIKIHRFGLDAALRFGQMKIDTLVKDNQMFIEVHPYYKIYHKNWQFHLGANICEEMFLSDSTKPKFHISPNVYLQHNIGNIFVAYAGVKGGMERNDLDNISRKNPFINVFNDYSKNTENFLVCDLGFKGYPTQNIYFNISGNFSWIKNMPFFVNDTSFKLQNKFLMEYADVKRFSGFAELAFHNFYKFDISLTGHYYYYLPIDEQYDGQFEKPWHCPNFDISLITTYHLNDKLRFGLNFQVIGPRYAREYETISALDEFANPFNKKEIKVTRLKTIVDISLFGEYQIFRNFSAFLDINNITAQKQYYWNNYQSLGFNFLLGLKYIF